MAQLAAIAALVVGATYWLHGQRDTAADTRPGGPVLRRVVIAPGDDPSALPLPLENARLIEVDRNGALLVHHGARVRREMPRAYQDINGRRQDVVVRFDITAAGDARLVAGAYDRTRPLVIEPETGKE